MATKDIGNLRTRLSWEDEGANKSLEGFRRDLKGLRSEMNAARSKGREYTQSLKGMREQSDILSRRLKTQQERVQELRKRYEESARVKGEDAKQTQDLAAQYNNAVAEMNRTEEQLKRLNSAIREQSSPWTKLGENMTKTGDKLQTVGRSMTDFGKNYSMKVTAPIVAGGTAIFKASMDFESAFAGVRKTVDATEEEFAVLRQGIRDMAKELPASANEIANVAEVAGQLGIKQKDIMKFTRTMVDLGVATNMSSEEAATALARLANITQMPMENIDRLGATVVDLGNNLATTESEIVDMALRLAGAGSQIGLSEAQILAFAGALSSVGIQAEMGGSAFSRVMIEIANASAGGEQAVKAFSDVAGMSAKDFQKAFEEDAALAVIAFIEGLDKMAKEGKNVFGVLEDLGLSEIRVRDTLLRAAGAGDLFRESLELGSKAWKENTALTKEAEERYKTTESQIKIMWNRIKDVAITLGDALVPAVMSAIDAAEPLIKQIESGAKAFAEMDEEQQRTILKLIAIAAAIGPVSVGLGGLTTTIGGVLKVGGGLASMLGKAGGAGLVGRIGLLGAGAATPVGLAVAGVGALTLGIYALSKASQENLEETLKSIEARKEELDSMDELIRQFEELKNKNKLSTDEMLRYMDIMTELKDAKNEETIKKLTDEQQELLKKSGLTNEEMEEFLGLNDQIVEKAPESAKAISEQGNAYAGVLDELKKLNEAERQRLTDDTYTALTSELDKQAKNLEKQAKIQSQIKEKESERETAIKNILEQNGKIQEQDLKIAELRDRIKNATGEERVALSEKLIQAQDEKALLEAARDLHNEQVEKIDNQIGKKKESLAETEKELAAFDNLAAEYEQQILFQAGLTAEKGKGVQKLHEEQKKIDDLRKENEKLHDAGKRSTHEYQKQIEKLNEQQKKIDTAKQKLEEMNTIAGRTIYKDVNVETNPTADAIDEALGASVEKMVNLSIATTKLALSPFSLFGGLGYAKGTDNHPGGPFLAGEEGFELGRLGNRWELLNFGLYDRPRGYEVFTHDESKKILRALNNLPGYATGARDSGEANRVVNQLNNQQAMSDGNATVVRLLKDIVQGIKDGKIIQIDGNTVTRIVNENNAVDNIGRYF
ncbi:phage tail tape measure protein [Bacillus sp. VT-16-64]|nr:phage tail tape measure protein [Bacillus sp. VT-16-64]